MDRWIDRWTGGEKIIILEVAAKTVSETTNLLWAIDDDCLDHAAMCTLRVSTPMAHPHHGDNGNPEGRCRGAGVHAGTENDKRGEVGCHAPWLRVWAGLHQNKACLKLPGQYFEFSI